MLKKVIIDLRVITMPSHSRFSINLALNAFNILLNIELSDCENRDLINDSRDLKPGDIFAATVGHLSDGRDYIENAIAAGAELILVQCEDISAHGKVEFRKPALNQSELKNNVTLVHFYELNKHLSSLANLYYQQPHHKLTTIGITGTNGKTTISQIIAQLLECSGRSCAVIGTVGAGKLDALNPIKNTTPGPTELNKLLHGFVHEGVTDVAMEVSSHALEQHRLSPSMIDVAVFTNLSRDHLDYHQTMENYAQAKKQLFTQNATQIAILNGDDNCAQGWLKSWPSDAQVIVYGINASVKTHSFFLHATQIKRNTSGVEFTIESHKGEVTIQSALMGDFNISNILAAAAVLLSQHYTLAEIAQSISQLKAVVGRMEVFTSPNLPTSVVDYAHTPDALENALKACRAHCNGSLHVVFGCGGDRDKGKRPQMGVVAEIHADHIVLTNDNPRTESPEKIVSDILVGCKYPKKVNVILARKKAVMNTIEASSLNDMILFAGKGHEDHIVIGNEKIAYNERELVQSIYANKAVS